MFIRLTETTGNTPVLVNTEQILQIRPVSADDVIIYLREGNHIYADISFDKMAGMLVNKELLVYDN